MIQYRRVIRVTTWVMRQRLQTIGWSQTPLQRRKQLATFRVRVASGTAGAVFQLKDIEADVAVRLADALRPAGRILSVNDDLPARTCPDGAM